MSLTHLAKTTAPVGMNNRGGVFVSTPSAYEETFTSTSPTAFALGNTVSVDVFNNQDALIHDVRFKTTITNNHGTDTLVFRTLWDLVDEVKIKVNNVEIMRHSNSEEIQLAYSHWYLDNCKEHVNTITNYMYNYFIDNNYIFENPCFTSELNFYYFDLTF